MSGIPTDIRVLKDQGRLELTWPGGQVSPLGFYRLRVECPCAACVNEFTGERILDPATIPADVRPEQVGFAGNYGLKIGWTDGHHSGIYTWERLASLDRNRS